MNEDPVYGEDSEPPAEREVETHAEREIKMLRQQVRAPRDRAIKTPRRNR